ncbi:MAG: VWA domain-containing protein, partial [Bacillota bacterium]|nr:VWA domain-containing protein [Bacillota bacterium]
SFGPGGYFRTPVERALPVFMDIRGRGEIPSLGLMLVIDKSGSMSETSAGISKVELAKEAAIRSTEILGPRDVIGVIAFDGEPKWVVEPTTVTDPSRVQDDIATIRAGGGTNIYPALDEAYKALKDQNTKYRHVILLTDGMSASGGDYESLLRDMRQAGITVSTVAVGNDADRRLLERIAKLGEGRYYFSNDTSRIPKIFTKETILASRNYVVEGAFLPRAGWPSPLSKGLDSVPQLGGYIATTAKQTAQTVLESQSGEPVLAAWQYGLGRALAWTSDTRGRWTREWLEAGCFGTLWANIAGWVAQPDTLQGFDSTMNVRGDVAELRVDTDITGITGIDARVVGPDGRSLDLAVEPVAPGRFQASFPAGLPGVYIAQITPRSAQGPAGTVLTGVAVPYSPEYKVTGVDRAFLDRLAAAGGGKVLSRPEEAYARDLKPAYATTALGPYLLALACLLLPLEIAARKLYIGREDMQHVRLYLRSLRPARAPAEDGPPLSHLLGRREEIRKGLDSSPRKGLESPPPAAARLKRSPSGPSTASSSPPGVPSPAAPPAAQTRSVAGMAVKGGTVDTSRLLARKKDREES